MHHFVIEFDVKRKVKHVLTSIFPPCQNSNSDDKKPVLWNHQYSWSKFFIPMEHVSGNDNF